MAPPNIPPGRALPSSSSSPPPLPSKQRGAATPSRTQSSAEAASPSSSRLVRKPSASSPHHAAASQQPLYSSRKPSHPPVCPSSSRLALANPTLDASQDHHRSDSGRSTGSSRSTATTDSFFLPQHPHVLNRRFKELPIPPTISPSLDTSRPAKQHETNALTQGLNIAVPSSSPASAALPATSTLYRSKSSASTTPTSPEEAEGSPYEQQLESEELTPLQPKAVRAHSTEAAPADGLDDFWKSDYSYARPSPNGAESSLPPLMRANAPIPPSRSQSLDPLAVPLDQASDELHLPARHDFTDADGVDRLGSPGSKLVAANLRKLEGEALHPVSSPPAQSMSTSNDAAKVAARPRLSPYQQPTASTSSSSSSAVGHRSTANKSTSSLSTSSAHGGDKTALATASKRSSTSSSSSFRMTLSRQAKSLRNSFLWSPPSADQPQPVGSERMALGQSTRTPGDSLVPGSQGIYSGVIDAASSSTHTGSHPSRPSSRLDRRSTVASRATDVRSSEAPKRGSVSSSTSHAFPVAPSLAKQSSIPRLQNAVTAKASSRPANPVSDAKRPTDYSKIEERPKSRLSSRLLLQGSSLSLKIPHLKNRKPLETSKNKTVADSAQSKTQNNPTFRDEKVATDAVKAKAAAHISAVPVPMDLPASQLLSTTPISGDPQLSPSFAETFAFLNSHIYTVDQPFTPGTTVVELPSDAAGAEAATPSVSKAEDAALSLTAKTIEKVAAKGQAVVLNDASVVLPRPQRTEPEHEGPEGKALKVAMFDRLADSPEAVYKTLVFPEVRPVPPSQSLDSIVPPKGRSSMQKPGHKKQMSLGSVTLISKSAQKAASDLDKRASGAPVVPSGLALTHGQASTHSLSSVLPAFTPVDEESRFFDALTSPLREQPPTAGSSPSLDNSALPSFATASEFFPRTKAADSSTSPGSRSMSMANIAAMTNSTTDPRRSSLGRRLSGVFDTPRTRAAQPDATISPPQGSRPASPSHALAARPETSLGFHLRNPLRRDRKVSLKNTKPEPTAGALDALEKVKATSAPRTMSPAAALRKMSSGFKTERITPSRPASERPGTSLGFSTSSLGRGKTPRTFSSSVLAPTKSSLARSVQPLTQSNGRSTVRSASASTLTTPESQRPSRSPQRPANPPSSFRAGPSAGSRASPIATGSPSKPSVNRSVPAVSKPRSAEAAKHGLSRIVVSDSGKPTGENAQRLSPEPLSPMESNTALVDSNAGRMDMNRRRTLSRPVLSPIRTSMVEDRPLARPSTALGFRGGMNERKKSQPTLDMVDDREFLEALESVRQIHRERIQAHAQDLENKTRLARLGMMSGNYLKTKISGSMIDDDEPEDRTSTLLGEKSSSVNGHADRGRSDKVGASTKAVTSTRLRHKRSASAGAKLGRPRSASSVSRKSDQDIDQRQKDIVKSYADKVSPVGGPTTGLEWGVGKASGNLHDGAFVNDDDWKKEVKALFLIRELVQTERSYARHLSSLLSVVRNIQTAPGGSSSSLGAKRKSASNLFAAYSSAYAAKTSASGSPPGHIALLRLHLPQLIALSNALVHRVESNPTSAGVGAAFDALAVQLEATFVGWSGVASQALKELRSTELAKGKSPYKIGLVPLTPRDSSEVGATTSDASSASGNSSPGLGLHRQTLRMTSLTRPPSPVGAPKEQERELDGSTMPAKRSTKRRSTITSTSFVPPRVVVASPSTQGLGLTQVQDSADSTSALEQSSAGLSPGAEGSRTSVTPSRRFGHSRSQSTLVTPLPTPTSGGVSDMWPGLTMTPSAGAGPGMAGQSQLGLTNGATAKCLTPMDITIMPTQRIPRYGLMLRDLLRNTPPESLSHARVQRAIALIQKVALLCDSAAPAPALSRTGGSGTASPSRANSVLGMASRESLSMGGSPLLPASSFSMTKRS